MEEDMFSESQSLAQELQYNEEKLRKLLTTVWEERRSSAASIAALLPPSDDHSRAETPRSARSVASSASMAGPGLTRYGDAFTSTSIAARIHAMQVFDQWQQRSGENTWKYYAKWRTSAMDNAIEQFLKQAVSVVNIRTVRPLLSLLEDDYTLALICFGDGQLAFRALRHFHLRQLLASTKELMDTLDMPSVCCLWANFNLLHVHLCQRALVGLEPSSMDWRHSQAFDRYTLSVQCWLDVTICEMERSLEDGRWSTVVVTYKGTAVPILKKLLPFGNVAQALVIFWNHSGMHERVAGIRENIKRMADLFAKTIADFPKKISWEKLELLIATFGFCRSEIEQRMNEIELPVMVMAEVTRPLDELASSCLVSVVSYVQFVANSYLMRDVESCNYAFGRPFWQNTQMSYCVRSWYHFVSRIQKFLWSCVYLPANLRQESFAAVVAESLKAAVINYSQYKVSLARLEQFKCDLIFLIYGAADFLPFCGRHASDFVEASGPLSWHLEQIQSYMKQLSAILAVVTCPIVDIFKVITSENMPAITEVRSGISESFPADLAPGFKVECSYRLSDLDDSTSGGALEFELRLFECQLQVPFDLLLEVLYLRQHMLCELFLHRLWDIKGDEQARGVFSALIWFLVHCKWDKLGLARMLSMLPLSTHRYTIERKEQDWNTIKESIWFSAIEQSIEPLLISEFRSFFVTNVDASFADATQILRLLRRLVTILPTAFFGLETFLVDTFGESLTLSNFLLRLIWHPFIAWIKPALEWDWRQTAYKEQIDDLWQELLSHVETPDPAKGITEHQREILSLCTLIQERQKHSLVPRFDIEKLPYSVARVASEHEAMCLRSEENGQERLQLLAEFVSSNLPWLRKQMQMSEVVDLKQLSMSRLSGVSINWRQLLIGLGLQTAEVKSLVCNRPEFWDVLFDDESVDDDKRMIEAIKRTLILH